MCCRVAYSSELDDQHDEVSVGAVVGDDREFYGAVYCMMYFDVALTREQLSAATSICRTHGLFP